MKLNGGASNKVRIVFWTVMAGSLAVAVAAPSRGGPVQDQDHATRKSTDPPVMSRGKMAQDLFLAIDHRDNPGVQSLIKKGADPNSRNGLEFTPLYIAAASFQPDVMETLLSAGAKVDAASNYGTPLTFAAASGNFPGANLLLARGASVNTSRTDGITVLMMAANSGSPELVAELLKRKADVNAKNDNDATALNFAARQGHEKVARMLVQAGATVDNANAEGQTPLMDAAATGHGDCVRMLLEKGAKANARDSKGRTALILAASYGDYPDVVSALLKGGADAKATDSQGCSAAAFATVRGYKASASLLGKPSPAAIAAVGEPRDARSAIPVSLKALQTSMMEFSKNTACISCHQEGLGRIATGIARDHGFAVDPAVHQMGEARVGGALNFMRPLHEQALKNPEVMKQLPLIEINEVTTLYAWMLTGMAAQKDPPSPATAAMAMVLARQQNPAGFWSFSLPRIPMQSSFFTFTALSIRSLSTYGPKSDRSIGARISKAKNWLLQEPAKTSEDCASRVLGLMWAGASKSELRKPMAGVLALQHPDGGWSQVPGLQSDAYATGQALYALHVGAGLPVNDPVYKRGVQYLLRTQDKDGSWFVNKRAVPANNYFDAGFPHGESQYASFNGTCWATMALLESVGGKR